MTQLRLDDANCLHVLGELNFANVAKLYRDGLAFVNQHPQLLVDFTEATVGDSSILAVLVAWSRRSKQLQYSLNYINLPNTLIEMARLSHLDTVLPISK